MRKRERARRDVRKEKSRGITPRMGCTTRYRPWCIGEKTEKREAPVETSVETSNDGRGRDGDGRERRWLAEEWNGEAPQGWFQPRLIGLYCGGMTSVTWSRRAFASSSKFTARSLPPPSPFLFPPHGFFLYLPLYLLRLYSEHRVPAGFAIPKLNTVDDSRGRVSAGKRSGEEISVLWKLYVSLSLSLFLSFSLFLFFIFLFYYFYLYAFPHNGEVLLTTRSIILMKYLI